MLSCVGDHILQKFNTLYLTRYRTYTIARPPQTKTLEGRGLQTDKHLQLSPFKGEFFLDEVSFSLLSISLSVCSILFTTAV